MLWGDETVSVKGDVVHDHVSSSQIVLRIVEAPASFSLAGVAGGLELGVDVPIATPLLSSSGYLQTGRGGVLKPWVAMSPQR